MKVRTCLIAALWMIGVGRTAAITAPPPYIANAVPAVANTTFPDEDGDYPAYIEIQADGTTFVSLNGYALVDNPSGANPWIFQGGIVGNGQILRVFASGKNRQSSDTGGFHTSFEFPCSIPYLELLNSAGISVSVFRAPENLCPTQEECDGQQLLSGRNITRTLIPTEDIGSGWTLPEFNDTQWIRGPLGVGYDAGENPFCDQLILHHPLDQATVLPNAVLDTSGPTLHDGILVEPRVATPALIAEGLRFIAGARGDYRVRVPHHPELDPGTGSFAATLWCRPVRDGADGIGFVEYLLSKEATVLGTVSGWSIYRSDAGTFIELKTGGATYRLSLGPITANQWHHIALVVDRAANQIRGYRDGSQTASTNLDSGIINNFTSTADLYEAGGQTSGQPYAGDLDEVAIWKRALSSTEINLLAEIGSKGTSFKDPSLPLAGAQLYPSLIGTDVQSVMQGANASAYVRVPFALANYPSLATSLRLFVQYDDGFIAHLNGVEVARRNAPSAVNWNSAASLDRPDGDALIPEVIDLSSVIPLLRKGYNVLAFQLLNSSLDAARTILFPQLCLKETRDGGTGEVCEKTTVGTDFWVAFPENFEEEKGAPVNLSLCIAGPPGAKGVVELPGQFGITWAIGPSRVTTVNLNKTLELEGPDRIERKGIHVISDIPVAVYGKSHIDYTTDSFLALPTPCLGRDYIVLGYQNVHDNIPLLHGTQFGIVAPYDATTITITPTDNVGAHPGGLPYSIPLQRGETYQLRNEAGAPVDLTGTTITSDKPIGVYGSHRCANIASSSEFFCDFVVEQMLPTALWGQSYYIPPLMTRQADTVRILAAQEKTSISINGAFVGNIDRGEFYETVIPLQGTTATRIDANKPVTVAQYSHSSNADNVIHSDPFMTLIQASDTWLTEYTICAQPTQEFPKSYINVVAQSTAVLNTIAVNGLFVVALPGADTGAFNNGYVYARAPLPAAPAGSYHLFAHGPFGLTSYGFDEFDSFGHPGGMMFNGDHRPGITVPTSFTFSAGHALRLPTTTAPDLISYAEFFDDCIPSITVVQSPLAGSTLTVGTHTITITALDPRLPSSGSVLLVSDNAYVDTHANYPGDPEIALASFLSSLGYEVIRASGSDATAEFRNANGGAAAAGSKGADLILVSRVTNSDDYMPADTWNAIGTPLLLLNPYLSRALRWNWMNNNTIDQTAVTGLGSQLLPDHPIVKGLGNDLFDAPTSLSRLSTPSGGNGTVIATLEDGDAALIEWEAGLQFYDGGIESAGERRVFLAGLRYHEESLSFDAYSQNGLDLLANAVEYTMTGAVAPRTSTTVSITLNVQASWEFQNFGELSLLAELEATVWGESADPDDDGFPNIIEKKTGSDPNVPNVLTDLVQLSFDSRNGLQYLKATFRRPILRDDCQLSLEGRVDFDTGVWQGGPDIFRELTQETVALPGGEFEEVSFKAMETEGPIALPVYFLRFRVD